MDEQTHSELIGRIYEAAALPELWPEALDFASEAFGGHCGHFFIWDAMAGRPAFDAVSANYSGQELYGRQYGGIDPRRELMRRRAAGIVIACHQHFDPAYVRESAFYNEFSIPNGRRFLLGSELTRAGQTSSILAVHRTIRQGPFGPEQIGRMQRLVPHLQRAAIIQQRVRQLRSEGELIQAALDRLSIGLVIADGSARCLAYNNVAGSILQAGDGLRLERGALAADVASDCERLKHALRQAAETAARRSGEGGCFVRTSRPSGLRDYILLVAPLAPDTASIGTGNEAALVLIRDPEERPLPNCSRLRELYGLTEAESRLAKALLKGQRLEEHAKERGVSKDTVRTQLSAILAKTNTCRQAELVGLLSDLPTLPGDPDQ